ncbi:MAG: gamma-glutamylcyclotransferase [Myxococcota bacterium]
MFWLFGYGSLIWRPDFPYEERKPAWIEGFARRFWQNSPDHRGTPENPGRVLTLTPAPGERCFGILYQVSDVHLASLDHRERGGYDRVQTVATSGEERHPVTLYLAAVDNPHFAGDAPIGELVEQILHAAGESGPNSEYVLQLDLALAVHGVVEPHIRTLADALRARGAANPPEA